MSRYVAVGSRGNLVATPHYLLLLLSIAMHEKVTAANALNEIDSVNKQAFSVWKCSDCEGAAFSSHR